MSTSPWRAGGDSFPTEEPLPAALCTDYDASGIPEDLRVVGDPAAAFDPFLPTPSAPRDADLAVYVAQVRSVLARVQATGEARIRAVVARAGCEREVPPEMTISEEPLWVQQTRARAHGIVDEATDRFVRGIS